MIKILAFVIVKQWSFCCNTIIVIALYAGIVFEILKKEEILAAFIRLERKKTLIGLNFGSIEL